MELHAGRNLARIARLEERHRQFQHIGEKRGGIIDRHLPLPA